MSRSNKERRAAKARQRRRQSGPRWGAGAGRGAWYGVGGAWHGAGGACHGAGAGVTVEAVELALVTAARTVAGGSTDAARSCASDLLSAPAQLPPRLVERAGDSLLRRVVSGLWRCGWQPEDLNQIVRRRLSAAHVGLTRTAIAAEATAYSPVTLHPRWRTQLDDLTGPVAWPADGTILSVWAASGAPDRVQALSTMIELLALWLTLPPLHQLLPPPGSAHNRDRHGSHGSSHGKDERALARVRALLAKAESTDFPEEAEALTAKAQELMTRYALKRLVESGQHDVPEPASARRIWLDAPYAGAKALLVKHVAEANRASAVWSEGLGFVTVIGAASDLDDCELLATSLLVQATRAVMTAGRDGDGRRSRSRSYRQSFLVAYATRIGERLGQAARATTDEMATGDLLPVLAAVNERVADARAALFPGTVARSVSVSDRLGWAAGRAAADLALLDTRGEVTEAASAVAW